MIYGCPAPGCDLVVGKLGDTAWWGCPDGHRTRTPQKLPDDAVYIPHQLACPHCGHRFAAGAVMAHDMVCCPRCTKDSTVAAATNITRLLADARRKHVAELKAQLAEPDPFEE